jgi:phosphate-selective porin OprO and OprP
MKSFLKPDVIVCSCVATVLFSLSGYAAPEQTPETTLDRLWSLPTLYKNEQNPLLQEFAIQGQLQTQYAYGSDDSGNFGTGDQPEDITWGDVEVRRMRLGAKARLLNLIKLQSLFDLYPDLSPRIYNRIVEAYLTFAFDDAFSFSIGKTELRFSREQEISSREILPFERSLLEGMLYGGQLTGAWFSGKGIADGFLYEIGVYGNDRDDEFTELNGGAMILAKVGYNYAKQFHWENGQVALHYLHNTDPGFAASPGASASPSYSDSIALSNDLTCGRFSLLTEGFWGAGANERSDIYGVTVQPAYYLWEKKLQLVTLLQLARSAGANGLVLPSRYEALAPGVGDKRGDAYFSAYAGLNYYIEGHKLKLMNGLKYSNMSGGSGGGDFDGWTWLSGIRMAF